MLKIHLFNRGVLFCEAERAYRKAPVIPKGAKKNSLDKNSTFRNLTAPKKISGTLRNYGAFRYVELPAPFGMFSTHACYHALSHVFLSLTLTLNYVISRGDQGLVAKQKRRMF